VDDLQDVTTPQNWLGALERSEAQLAAGQTVPAEPIMQRLRDSIAELERKAADKPRRSAPARR
jgi:hypothetical protein